MSLLQLAAHDRPRERMLALSSEALSDAELVALVLGTGRKGASAVEVAAELLSRLGDLRGLAGLPAAELAAHLGLGAAKACALAAALELGRRAQRPVGPRPKLRHARDVSRYARPRLAHLRHEVFHALCLTAKNGLIRDVRVAQGGATGAIVLPREAYAPVLREGAPAVVFVHNHPSGDPTPSDDDRELTATLDEAGRVLGVRMLDHVVLGEGRFYSFFDGRRVEPIPLGEAWPPLAVAESPVAERSEP